MNAPVEIEVVQRVPDHARQAAVAQALLEVLPAQSVLWEPTDTRPYECDGLSILRQLPMVVALPDTEEQIAAILRICSRMGVPVVARGAGTSLSGGAAFTSICCFVPAGFTTKLTRTVPAVSSLKGAEEARSNPSLSA